MSRHTRRSPFAASRFLLGFILRRDRLRLPIWWLGMVGFVVLFVPGFEQLFMEGMEVQIMAEMMRNPAMVASVGPLFGEAPYSNGALFSAMMLLFSTIGVAVMNILLVSRHTRQDEEEGRLELVRALPVGRLAMPWAVLVYALLVNLTLALGVGLGMAAMGVATIDLAGGLVFGLSMGLAGLYFAALTAVSCQLSANNRTAVSMAFGVLLLAYILRAIGDVTPGAGALSWLSPLGLALRSEAFVSNRLLPLGLLLLWALGLSALALVLHHRRDLGRGLVAERAGRDRAPASLASPLGLVRRLVRSSALIWAFALYVLAAMYGSVFGDLDAFFEGNEMLRMMVSFASASGHSMAEQFISLLVVVMSLIALIPALQQLLRIAAEERTGNGEQVLARPVARVRYMGAFLVVSLLTSAVNQLIAALGFWSAGRAVGAEIPPLGTFVAALLALLPAIWLTLALGALLFALWPRRAGLVYVYLFYSFFSTYIGALAKLPEWFRKLTPFGYLPRYPVEPLAPWTLLAMLALTALVIAAALVLYRRRDLSAA